MPHSPLARRGIGLAAGVAVLALAACSKTPTYVSDSTGGSGGVSHGASSSSTSSSGVSSTSSATSSSSGMAPTACANPGDCGMVTTACAHPVCAAGVCGVQLVPMGTPITAQASGDCKKNVCDGLGNVTSTDDPADLPHENNTCTNDTCTGSTPVHTPEPAGFNCGPGGLVCDAAGHCTGCKSADKCGAHGPCYVWACNSMVCEPSFLPAGTGDPGDNAPGDCQKYACDGMGGVAPIDDPNDLPAAPSACVLGACNGGVPGTKPAPAGTQCLGGTCDGAGHCGVCNVDTDCGPPPPCATPACVAGHCSATYTAQGTLTATQTAGDCRDQTCDAAGGVTSVANDADVPPNPDACTTSSCSAGMVVHTPVTVPSSGNACIADGCDPVTGVFHHPLADGTGCGGCSTCQATVCTDPCPAMGLVCMGTTCG